MKSDFIINPSSYKDPAGFVFYHNDTLYRQVNKAYQPDYDQLIQSKLYNSLVDKQYLISHKPVNTNFTGQDSWYLTIQPEVLPFISYPYEWSFDMLKDAALLTLKITKESINYGMILKDATPFNVDLYKGNMIFIDSLSFEQYNEEKPWIAYNQFCESFLMPLALMHFAQIPLHELQYSFPNGIPLSIGVPLLPWRSKLNLNSYLHLHLSSKITRKNKLSVQPNNKRFTKQKLINILTSLEETVNAYNLNKPSGLWSNYYKEAVQRPEYIPEKKQIIKNWITQLPGIKTAVDVGANVGLFSELLAHNHIFTLAADFDHYSINELYKKIKNKTSNIHPLLIDFTNPSPAIGVNNKERPAFLDRSNSDLVVALAVIHHLAIGKNIPFNKIAELFIKMGKILIVEFIPKNDEKVQVMLENKKDIYSWYNEEEFKNTFKLFYTIKDVSIIGNSNRSVYLMQPHEASRV